jgi:hypothetical protein
MHFSQTDEDEIIERIFRRIGSGGKRFVEFGCGDGRQNNTIALLHDGWSGIWLDPHKRRIASARERFAGWPVEIKRRMVTPQNVNRFVTDPLDFLSIDIDGNDYAVWDAITARPRVVCIECTDPRGTPLEPIKALGQYKGYDFLMTSMHGTNAFFVHANA